MNGKHKHRLVQFLLIAAMLLVGGFFATNNANAASAQPEMNPKTAITAPTSADQVCVTTTTLFIRLTPSMTGRKVGKLFPGEQITVTEVSGLWVKHSRGWSNIGYLRCTAAPATGGGTTTTGENDLEWLQSIADDTNAIDQFNEVWEATDNWKAGEARAQCAQVPVHTAVIGSWNGQNPTGSDFNLQTLAPNLHYIDGGGAFCTNEGFRAMQLDGAPGLVQGTRPTNVAEVVAMLTKVGDCNGAAYEACIAALDTEWSGNNPNILNRWGSHGPHIYNDQITEPLCQLLPGDTVVWGALAQGDYHWGLKLVYNNIYVTTGDGGYWCTFEGYRAMQIK